MEQRAWGRPLHNALADQKLGRTVPNWYNGVMQRYLFLGALASALVIAGPAMGAERRAHPPKTYQPADKFMRGLVNIITSPLEIPRRIRRRTEGDNTLRGWTLGTTQGLGYTVVRLAAGAYEVLTFPAPAPKDYKPVLEPEYVWEEDAAP